MDHGGIVSKSDDSTYKKLVLTGVISTGIMICFLIFY